MGANVHAAETRLGDSSPSTNRSVVIAAALSIVVGLALVTWALLVPGEDTQIPFTIEPSNSSGGVQIPDDLIAPNGFEIARFSVRVEGAPSPVAESAHLVQNGISSAILAWKNNASEPVISPDVSASEISKLAEAIKKHTNEDDLLVGFPGFVSAVAFLSGRQSLVKTGAPSGLLLPDMWQNQRQVIEEQQARFWAGGEDRANRVVLSKFAEALLSDELTGAATVAALAKGRRAFLVVHIADILRLGAIYPDRFRVGYRDFPGSGRSHGSIKTVKSWLNEKGYKSYAVEQRDGDYARVYFLMKDDIQNSLIAQALPFSTSNPLDLKIIQLVYQTGGAWVFQIKPLDRPAGP